MGLLLVGGMQLEAAESQIFAHDAVGIEEPSEVAGVPFEIAQSIMAKVFAGLKNNQMPAAMLKYFSQNYDFEKIRKPGGDSLKKIVETLRYSAGILVRNVAQLLDAKDRDDIQYLFSTEVQALKDLNLTDKNDLFKEVFDSFIASNATAFASNQLANVFTRSVFKNGLSAIINGSPYVIPATGFPASDAERLLGEAIGYTAKMIAEGFKARVMTQSDIFECADDLFNANHVACKEMTNDIEQIQQSLGNINKAEAIVLNLQSSESDVQNAETAIRQSSKHVNDLLRALAESQAQNGLYISDLIQPTEVTRSLSSLTRDLLTERARIQSIVDKKARLQAINAQLQTERNAQQRKLLSQEAQAVRADLAALDAQRQQREAKLAALKQRLQGARGALARKALRVRALRTRGKLAQ